MHDAIIIKQREYHHRLLRQEAAIDKHTKIKIMYTNRPTE